MKIIFGASSVNFILTLVTTAATTDNNTSSNKFPISVLSKSCSYHLCFLVEDITDTLTKDFNVIGSCISFTNQNPPFNNNSL